MKSPKVIALYLPQYHPFAENNKWWGHGFTEWTNVAKAKPLFKGHYQPKIPADLGFYDLRLPETRELQAELAKKSGIDGFCYYHYWFGEKELMQRPFDEVVDAHKPDFPFCLCWANQSWHSKFWSRDGEMKTKLLIEQKYLGQENNEAHFNRLLKAFEDERYMRYGGKLIFMIYKPLEFKDVSSFIQQWNDLARQNGLNGFYFIGQSFDTSEIDKILALGFDAVNLVRLHMYLPHSFAFKVFRRCYTRLFNRPIIFKYKNAIKVLDGVEDEQENVIPSIIPNWDHTPRSGVGGVLLHNSTPELFKKHVNSVFGRIKNKDNTLVILKSWNEWGEGNYMEPDLRFGMKYIETLKHCIDDFKDTVK